LINTDSEDERLFKRKWDAYTFGSKKDTYLDNLKKYTSISDLGHLGNTPIASEDEQINNPSSVQGQKINDTKTYPQLFPELTREFNQKYGKAKSEDVDCS